MSEHRLLATGDLAKELGVTAGTVRHYERTGRIHATGERLGGHRRFRLGEVIEQLRAQGVDVGLIERDEPDCVLMSVRFGVLKVECRWVPRYRRWVRAR